MSDSLQKHNGNGHKNSVDKYEYVPTYAVSPDGTDGGGLLDPQKIIALILRYKWLVLTFLILGGIGGWFYSESVTPIYESKGTMIISTGGAGDDELSQIINQATGYGTSSTLANELQVLSSRQFSEKIAKRMIEQSPGDINEFPVLWNEDEEGNVSRANQNTVTNRIRSGLKSIRSERDAEVIEISFQSPSPKESAFVVNLAMEVYEEESTSQNRFAAESTAEFLEKEREEVKKRLEEAEKRLEEYMNRNDIIRMDAQSSRIVAQQTEVEMELQRINIELETIEQAISNHEQQMERLKPGLTEQFSEAVGPRISSMQEQLAQYEGERTLILTRNPNVRDREQTPPRLKFLDEEIERVKEDIRTLSQKLFSEDNEYMGMDGGERARMITTIQTRLVELRIQENSYLSRKKALEERKQEIERSFDTLPEGMMELARLERDVRLNEELFVNISRQFADMSFLKQSKFGFGRILDTALVPGSPVSPNKTVLLIMGIMLGGLFVTGLIFLKEFTDNSVNSVEVVKAAKIPLLSAIPVMTKVSKKSKKSFKTKEGTIPKELILLRDRSNIVSESIRRLKNNIIYQNGETPPKTIAITSAEKGDGKSTIVSNLGIAFAEEGYKTLIVDTDFRRPKIHDHFKIINKYGLTDYLSGKLESLQLIHSTDISKLKVITSGSKSNHPENIVNSKQFREFVKKMDEIFDVIIFDTPPFGIISDSASLLKSADSVILVAKYQKTNKGVYLRTIEELERINASINGIVLNGFDPRKETGSDYGSGYYKSVYGGYEQYI